MLQAAPLLRRQTLLLAAVFGFWTLIAFLSASQMFVYYSREEALSFWTLVLRQLPVWYLWALITLVTFTLARRVPIRPERWLVDAGLHLVIGLGVAAAMIALVVLYNRTSPELGEQTFGELYGLFASRIFHYYFLFYVAIVGIYHAVEFHRRYRERELRASRLQAQLAEAQLRALKMQLHPHFLFNTLHAISAYMDEDVKASRSMLALLGELLRLTLDKADVQEVTLQQEMAFVERYLEIQQIRFRNMLEVHYDIAPEVQRACVPNLILQPLVENALKHGVAASGTVSRVEIAARRQEALLVLQVADNGPGLPGVVVGKGPVPHRGIGLRNTEERLAQLYGDQYQLRFEQSHLGGLLVTVALPFYTEAAAFEVLEVAPEAVSV